MKTIRIFCQLAFLGVTLAVTAGCNTQKTWVYRANSYPPAVANTEKKIAVLPFEDDRTNINRDMTGIGYVPLVPYGWAHLNAPEGSSMHLTSSLWLNYKPTEDFPKALADDLRNTGVFSDSFFAYQRDGSDYAVEGKILNTKYDGYLITYGLSIYGAYLWIFGFPATVTHNELALKLNLVNSRTDQTLFSKVYTATPRKNTSWLYDIKSDFNYADMMAEVNLQFCHDIEPIVLKEASESTALVTTNVVVK